MSALAFALLGRWCVLLKPLGAPQVHGCRESRQLAAAVCSRPPHSLNSANTRVPSFALELPESAARRQQKGGIAFTERSAAAAAHGFT